MTLGAQVSLSVQKFLDGALLSAPLSDGLPLLGGALSGLVASIAFDTLDEAIAGALTALPAPDDADAIAGALDALDGVAASVAGGRVEIRLTAEQVVSAALGPLKLDFGGSALGLTASAGVGGTITASLGASFVYDAAADILTYVDAAGDELSLALDIALDVAAGATLGGLTLFDIVDTRGPDAPELQLVLGVDAATLDPGDATATLTGAAALGLSVSTGAPAGAEAGVLPTFYADIDLAWDAPDFGAAPTADLAFGVELKSLLDTLTDMLGPVADFLFSGAVGDVIDALTDPLPIIDDGIRAIPGLSSIFDLIPRPDGDDTINVLDLLGNYLRYQAGGDGGAPAVAALSTFAEAIGVLKQIRDAGASGRIELGSTSLSPQGVLSTFEAALTNGLLPNDYAQTLLKATEAFRQVVETVQGVLESGTASLSDPVLSDDDGVKIPLIDNPELVLNILLPGLVGGGAPVTIIEYDLPAQTFEGHVDEFFNVIGPFGVALAADFYTRVDFQVGYDTAGLATGKFIDGVYLASKPLRETLATAPLDPTPLLPGQPKAVAPFTYTPLAFVTASASAGIGVGLPFANVSVGGGPNGFAAATLPDSSGGRLRASQLAEGCFLEVTGAVTADLSLRISIGFGFFKFTETFTLAEATLVTFEFGCDGGATDPGLGLADLRGGPAGGLDMVLHMGVDASLRSIDGKLGADGDEVFRVANAVDADGAPIAGGLTINYRNVLDTYVGADRIVARDMGAGADALIVSGDVRIAVEADGGGGDDILHGGGGADLLRGGDGLDHLHGGDGDDSLFGGADEDFLEGGAGADLLDGGDGAFDRVSYYDSAVGVTFRPDGDGFLGEGGDAQGDRLVSIEYIVGSNFVDVLIGNNGQSNTLDGRAGNDILRGGVRDDYILGGAGADDIDGLGGRNATSYITSRGAVQFDLRAGWAFGGDAQGDRLVNIQDVHGTAYSDGLRGDDRANRLDGWIGDDTLWGRGGADDLSGDGGDDIVYAGADGDTVDGGAGRDLLSYAEVTGFGVSVDLGAGDGGGADVIRDRVFFDAAGVAFTVAGNSSFEDLDGSNQNDALAGDNRANTIRGLFGDDIIDGAGGDDWLQGGFGADRLIGGLGQDWADYRDGFGVTAYLDFGLGFGSTAAGDILSAVENLRGSDSADFLFGSAVDNVIDPGLSRFGVDQVIGRLGGGDEDTLWLDYARGDFGGGVAGGFTFDLFGYSLHQGGFRRFDASGATLLDGVDFSEMERLVFFGTSRADTVRGGGDTGDFIMAGGGDDVITAQFGADTVLSQEGDDRVIYSATFGPGDDGDQTPVFHLDGGRGVDRLSITFNSYDQTAIVISAPPSGVENAGVNWSRSATGAAIENFEILDFVATGAGRDRIEQRGFADNTFFSGDGEDELTPGWGVDFVDGGADFQNGVEANFFTFGNTLTVTSFLDPEAFLQNDGDHLVLDYGDLSSGVTGSVESVDQVFFELANLVKDTGRVRLSTTSVGTYRSDAGDVDLSFQNIERLTVTGSRFGDRLEGTQDGFFQTVFPAPVTRRGDDVLRGLDGDDVLIGYNGDDVLDGGDGDDILSGGDEDWLNFFGFPVGEDRPPNEVDLLTGGAGADTFVLGVSIAGALGPTFGYFYGRTGAFQQGYDSRAIITDFDAGEGDVIQLVGAPGAYRLDVQGAGTDQAVTRLVLLTPGVAPQTVAELRGVDDLDLTADYMRYIGPGDIGVGGLAGYPEPADPAQARLAAPVGAAFAPAAIPVPWVRQENDADALLSALFDGGDGGIDLSTDALTLTGDARAFGVFDGDPFGLGSGIVLSTGQVEDLAGPNLVDGGYFLGRDVALTFEEAGVTNGSRIFRADLSALGVDIRSFVLRDGGSGVGGAEGRASGFDIDGIVLSRTFLDNITAAIPINDQSVLPTLDVFNYSAAFLDYRPGTQRQTDRADLTGPFFGTVGGQLVDNAFATLGVFDTLGTSANPEGVLTLGDNGSLGIELTEAVATDQPLYLYVAEAGLGTNETLDGLITASANRLSTPADLSTDFGRPGAEDDAVSLSYSFRTAAGSAADTLVFDFVLFSEELVEYAGSVFNDAFSIRLNGVELAQLSDGSAATVNNLRSAPFGPSSADLTHNPVGTGPAASDTRADAFTGILSFAGGLQDGVNTLTIEAKDLRDGLLDSGVLVRAGSFATGVGLGGAGGAAQAGLLRFGDRPALREGDPAGALSVALDPGRALAAPVTLTFTPGADIDLGAGAGGAVSVVINPGDPLAFTLPVAAAADGLSEGPEFAAVDVAVASADPAYKGLAVAPLVFEVRDAENRAPSIATDALTMNENATLAGLVAATDPDAAQTLAYAVTGGADAALFVIDAGTGALSFVAAPDFESPGDANGDNVYDVAVTVADSGAPSLAATRAIAVIVQDVVETQPFAIAVGDAPERFSRAAPDAWRDAWSDDHIVFTHRAGPGDPWSAVDFGTVNPGALAGSDMVRGDLGVSGRTAAGGASPQEIDGTEALRVDFIDTPGADVTIRAITLALSAFSADVGGAGRHEAARFTVLDEDGDVLLRQVEFASSGRVFSFAALDGATALVIEAGSVGFGGDFVAGALSDGAAPTGAAASAFLLDSLDLRGDLLIS